MKIFKYKIKSQATKKQKSMKRLYGYTPSIFKVRNPKKRTIGYVVVKPIGLKKL